MSLGLDRETVRWYILLLPETHRGRATALEKAKQICLNNGNTSFDYLAPTFKEKRVLNGREKLVDIYTFYNYVFVRASVSTIFDLKQTVLSSYNFMRKQTIKGKEYYPFVSDDTMESLLWVASSYNNILPCYVPQNAHLKSGDTIRFTSGQFAGKSAEIVTIPGTNRKEFVIRVKLEDGGKSAELFSVPIKIGINECSYVVEQLNTSDKQTYARLDNPKLLTSLFEALVRQRHNLITAAADLHMAEDVIRRYGHASQDVTDIIRTRMFSVLLPAYRLLGLRKSYEDGICTAAAFMEVIKAKQSKVLLSLVLFSCTEEYFWKEKTEALLKEIDSSKRKDQYLEWLKILEKGYEPAEMLKIQKENVMAKFPQLIQEASNALEDDEDDEYAATATEADYMSALDTLDAQRLIAIRPKLLNGTYPIAINHETRALAQYLLWATQPMEDTHAARRLKALLYSDVMRTI